MSLGAGVAPVMPSASFQHAFAQPSSIRARGWCGSWAPAGAAASARKGVDNGFISAGRRRCRAPVPAGMPGPGRRRSGRDVSTALIATRGVELGAARGRRAVPVDDRLDWCRGRGRMKPIHPQWLRGPRRRAPAPSVKSGTQATAVVGQNRCGAGDQYFSGPSLMAALRAGAGTVGRRTVAA